MGPGPADGEAGAVGLSSERLERVSRALRSEIEAGKIPGAVALVARKGQVVYFESFGVRDKASGEPMSKDAIFRLYSMTKPFASVAAMMLMEDGKLLLTDPVAKFLPQLAKREVSVSQLDPATGQGRRLRGAGRARDDHPGPAPAHLRARLRHVHAEPRIKELYEKNGVTGTASPPRSRSSGSAKVPLAHQPGTTWEYSLSTDVLGRVVEKVSGAPLGRFLDERRLRPVEDAGHELRGAERQARPARPAAGVEPSTGQPIKLVDVTVPPKNDAGGAGSASTSGRLRALLCRCCSTAASSTARACSVRRPWPS